MTKRRRLERRASIRVVIDERDPVALQKLYRLKSDQFRATGALDALAIPWVAETLERLAGTRTEHFAGIVSTLYADDELIAVHLGLRHRSTFHYWFPAYDPEWSRYSPGSVLLLAMCEAMASQGVRTIDLGKGQEGYKVRFAGADYPVGNGSIELGGAPARVAAGVGRRAWSLALRTPLGNSLGRLKRRREFG
jgi:CelD/BcsL family acetyltransferase involved in cellulose biosynthesis